MISRSLRFPILAAVAAGCALLAGCATTISGRVVRPDGSALTNVDVVVYTSPRSTLARADKDGSFKIGKNVVPENEYTLIAEDKDGNTGYVRGFKPNKGGNENVIVRMSREVQAKDAVLEDNTSVETGIGPGEKILKSSQ